MPGAQWKYDLSRRQFLAIGAGLGAGFVTGALPLPALAADPLLTRPIPHSGEPLPVVGIGTAIVFDIGGDAAKRAERTAVIRTMIDGGARLIDTAPSYGTAEDVVGELLAAMNVRDRIFLATKVRVANRDDTLAEMTRSLERLKTPKVDLMQIHNVRDPNTSLDVLRAWRDQGRTRYIGITNSNPSSYGALAEVVRREKPDFLQVSLLALRAPGRGAPAADGAGCRHRRAYGAAFRPRQALQRGARQAAARLGGRDRRDELGAGVPQVPPRQRGRELRHPRHRQARIHDRQHERRARPPARRGDAQEDRRVLGSAGVREEPDPRIAGALERNDRYVREFVEAFNLCPYAKRTREAGRLQRVVLVEEGGEPGTPGFEAAVAALVTAAKRFEQMPPETIDVGLAIFPALVPTLAHGIDAAHAFEALVSAARERMQSRHPGGDTPFYCVPFHPGFAEDLADEHRAVRFIRRSPDPTVQFVRASVLRAVRGGGSTDYIDTSAMSTAELMAVSAPVSVSERIAQANLLTLQSQKPGRLRDLLADILVVFGNWRGLFLEEEPLRPDDYAASRERAQPGSDGQAFSRSCGLGSPHHGSGPARFGYRSRRLLVTLNVAGATDCVLRFNDPRGAAMDAFSAPGCRFRSAAPGGLQRAVGRDALRIQTERHAGHAGLRKVPRRGFPSSSRSAIPMPPARATRTGMQERRIVLVEGVRRSRALDGRALPSQRVCGDVPGRHENAARREAGTRPGIAAQS